MKKLVSILSVLIILGVGVFSVIDMYKNVPITYDGRQADVYAIMQDPSSYDDSTADGAAALIVNHNLEETQTVNDVTSIVFDYRGYDTMGEAFILVIAVTGTAVILRKPKKRWGEDE